jgi:hypothetical protein
LGHELLLSLCLAENLNWDIGKSDKIIDVVNIDWTSIGFLCVFNFHLEYSGIGEILWAAGLRGELE